ncbi:MAG: hypothetical protein H7177_06275 [Rhizobacter sp.]|nr:hypothetical protein [Bacteriovorax sp.]
MNIADEEKKHFVVSSFYWAQPSKGDVTNNNFSNQANLSIPGEIGGNLYYQYYLKKYLLGFYSGYDFEKINTFNTSEIESGSDVKNTDNKLHYATIGITHGFSLFDMNMNMNMNLKVSFSKIVSAQTSGTKSMAGQKCIVYYTYKPPGRFNFNVFYKHHALSGTTNLSIDRIGFSIGILIF